MGPYIHRIHQSQPTEWIVLKENLHLWINISKRLPFFTLIYLILFEHLSGGLQLLCVGPGFDIVPPSVSRCANMIKLRLSPLQFNIRKWHE